MVLGVALLSALAPDLRAQSNQAEALARLTELEKAVERLDSTVTQLNALLRSALPPSPVMEVDDFVLDLAGSASKGSDKARVILVEFSDFECPFCGRHASTAYRDILRRFVDEGSLRYVFKHLPLEQIHPQAMSAALGAECAGRQGRFWEMHDLLFANQRALKASDLEVHSMALKLDTSLFQACMADSAALARVQADMAEAKRLGLTATPAFLLGEATSSGDVRVTHRINGAQSSSTFAAAIELALNSAKDRQ